MLCRTRSRAAWLSRERASGQGLSGEGRPCGDCLLRGLRTPGTGGPAPAPVSSEVSAVPRPGVQEAVLRASSQGQGLQPALGLHLGRQAYKLESPWLPQTLESPRELGLVMWEGGAALGHSLAVAVGEHH